MNVYIPLQMDLVLRVSALLRIPYKLASEPREKWASLYRAVTLLRAWTPLLAGSLEGACSLGAVETVWISATGRCEGPHLQASNIVATADGGE
jgi:hypothetical protein